MRRISLIFFCEPFCRAREAFFILSQRENISGIKEITKLINKARGKKFKKGKTRASFFCPLSKFSCKSVMLVESKKTSAKSEAVKKLNAQSSPSKASFIDIVKEKEKNSPNLKFMSKSKDLKIVKKRPIKKISFKSKIFLKGSLAHIKRRRANKKQELVKIQGENKLCLIKIKLEKIMRKKSFNPEFVLCKKLFDLR